MKVLVVYATYSSGTNMAADIATQQFTAKGHEAILKDLQEVTLEDFNNYDLVVLASPSWDISGEGGHPHEHYVAFIEAAKGKTLPGKKFAVLGLGDRAYPQFCGAVDHLEKFVQGLQGKLATESLRIDGYFYNQDESNTQIQAWVDKIAS